MPVLESNNLIKAYGSLLATNDVSIKVTSGEMHALIGPNGAGKTTLIHLLSGFLPADSGEIILNGKNITKFPMHKRALYGLTRSFQITNIFDNLSLIDNLVLALQAVQANNFSLWSPHHYKNDLYEGAYALAQQCHIDEKLLYVDAKDLAHGEKRKLEFALTIASKPKIILLDEPMAGMGPDESQRLLELMQSLRGQFAMLLIEHDMDAVFKLADKISVLVNGQIIASDTPDAIKDNPLVLNAYLGEEDA